MLLPAFGKVYPTKYRVNNAKNRLKKWEATIMPKFTGKFQIHVS